MSKLKNGHLQREQQRVADLNKRVGEQLDAELRQFHAKHPELTLDEAAAKFATLDDRQLELELGGAPEREFSHG